MKPLNHQARSSARRKFSSFLLVSLLLVCLSVYLLLQVPTTFSPQVKPKPPDWMPAFKNKVDSIMVGQQHINILFVIDATDGMGEYYPAISKAIRSFATQADSSKIFRLAATLYRDAKEGSFLIEHFNRNTSAEAVAGIISSREPLKRYDKDEPEAVYFGLREALKLEHLQPRETNVVILIGDAGNHAQAEETNVAPEEIVNLLVEYASHFFALQVRHPATDPAYGNFIPQLRDEILTPVVTERRTQISQYDTAATVRWATTTDHPGVHYTLHQGNSYINDLFALDEGITLSPDELTVRIENIFKQVVQETDQRIEDLQMLKTHEALDASRMNAASVISILKNSNVPTEQLNYLTLPEFLEENKVDE
jgi:hypothetical protein